MFLILFMKLLAILKPRLFHLFFHPAIFIISFIHWILYTYLLLVFITLLFRVCLFFLYSSVLPHYNILFVPALPGFVVSGLCVGLFSLRTLFTP
jgi:hypothetical protein